MGDGWRLARNNGATKDTKYQMMNSSRSSRLLRQSDTGVWEEEASLDAVHMQAVVLRPCMILWRDIVS